MREAARGRVKDLSRRGNVAAGIVVVAAGHDTDRVIPGTKLNIFKVSLTRISLKSVLFVSGRHVGIPASVSVPTFTAVKSSSPLVALLL